MGGFFVAVILWIFYYKEKPPRRKGGPAVEEWSDHEKRGIFYILYNPETFLYKLGATCADLTKTLQCNKTIWGDKLKIVGSWQVANARQVKKKFAEKYTQQMTAPKRFLRPYANNPRDWFKLAKKDVAEIQREVQSDQA